MKWTVILAAILLCPLARGQEAFEFDPRAELAQIWGGRATLATKYFQEDLPALFSRTIVLDEPIPGDGALVWIFTGDQGGITVRISADRVKVIQRYYDSYALSEEKPRKARYPERILDEEEVPYTGRLKTVRVVLDDKLSLVVEINGKQALRRTCLLDLRRHQLAWQPATQAVPGMVRGRIEEPPPAAISVKVEPRRKRQTIYGFGGIMSFPAYARLSEEGKRRWWELVREYNLLIHREYPNGVRLKPDLSNFDRLDDATPHYYGDNFPNGEISDFEYSRRIKQLGGHVVFEFWQLPPWARQEYKDASGKSYPNAPNIPEYVRAVVGYSKIAREKSGYAPDIVGIQNEIVQPPELWHEMILRLRDGLDKEGFSAVKIHMPDHGNLRGGIDAARSIQRSAQAWKTVDYAATHVYDFQNFFQDPDGYDKQAREWKELTGDKPYLATEFTVNNSAYQASTYRIAFAMAELYHKNMALMDAVGLIYCWSLLEIEQPSFGATRSLFVPDRAHGYMPAPSGPILRTYGAFSRRLREGMSRVDAESGDAGLLVTAYEGKAGKTIILINRSVAPQRIRIDWPGAAFTQAEVVSPYQENAVLRAIPKVLLVQPGEILTLSTVPLAGGASSMATVSPPAAISRSPDPPSPTPTMRTRAGPASAHTRNGP